MTDVNLEKQLSLVQLERIEHNARGIANIVELTTSVMLNIIGKDTSDKIEEGSLNRDLLNNLIANRIKKQVLAGGQHA